MRVLTHPTAEGMTEALRFEYTTTNFSSDEVWRGIASIVQASEPVESWRGYVVVLNSVSKFFHTDGGALRGPPPYKDIHLPNAPHASGVVAQCQQMWRLLFTFAHRAVLAGARAVLYVPFEESDDPLTINQLRTMSSGFRCVDCVVFEAKCCSACPPWLTFPLCDVHSRVGLPVSRYHFCLRRGSHRTLPRRFVGLTVSRVFYFKC